jgi:hypothetical protein
MKAFYKNFRMDSKSKSIARSKKTSIKFADILAEGGISLLAPELAIVYKGIKLLVGA